MSLVPVFSALKARLLAIVANEAPFNQGVNSNNLIEYVQMWNNQLASWKDSYKQIKDDDLVTGTPNTYIPPMPALLIEFDNLNPVELGAGVQIFNDLIIHIHIVHQQLDAGDGTMEQNLEVFQLADAVYAALNKFLIPGCIELVRQAPNKLDYAHDNLYHYIVDFGTNYVDASQLEPVGGKTVTIKNLEIDLLKGNTSLGDENGNPIVDENNREILT